MIGYYTTPSIPIVGQKRIMWSENKPLGTDITVEYATGEIQGPWITISNGYAVSTDIYLWLRVTLEAEDTGVTPTLENIWIEDFEENMNSIILNMNPLKRFNNAEGNLTVRYDMSKGNLKGEGGPVVSFEREFLPIDLEAKPNPYFLENVSASLSSMTAVLENINFVNANNQDENVSASVSNVTIVLADLNGVPL